MDGLISVAHAHVCIHTWTHTHTHSHAHVEQQKEQQRNLGFSSNSAIESWTFVCSSVKGMVGPATSDSFPAHSWSCWGQSPLLISLSLSQPLLLKSSARFSQNFSESLLAWRGKHAFWLCVGAGLLSWLFQLFYKHNVRMKTWALGAACGALADLLPLPLQPGSEVHLPCLSGHWRLCSGLQIHRAPSTSDPT